MLPGNHTVQFHRWALLTLLLAVLALASGCSTVRTYDDRIGPAYSNYRQGNIQAAAKQVGGSPNDRRFRSTDRLLWTLEAGKLAHALHDFEESNRFFERAEAIVRDFEERPEYNIRAGAAQVGAIATNPNALPYQGSYADRIMINTYKALNYLALGDLEAARVEIRRAYERQRQAIADNDRAIEEARSQARSRNLATNSALNNPAFERAAPVDPAVAQAYANFSNPFTTFLSGLVYLADRDPARAEVDFRNLAALPLPNRFVQEELARLQAHLDGGNGLDEPRVYVIFENGVGPDKREIRIDLILPDLGYTGFAFPEIVFNPTPVRAVGLIEPGAGSPRLLTEQVASMDQILVTEFQLRMPAMALRTLTAVIAKEVAAKQLTDQLDAVGLILGSLYKALVNRADTRTWKTLGKEFQVASLERPESGKLNVALIGRNNFEPTHRKEVTLPDGDFVLVLVQSVNQHDLRVTVQALR